MFSKSPFAINGWLWLIWLAYWYIAAVFTNRTKASEGALQRFQHTIPLGMAGWLLFHGRNDPFIHGRLYFNDSIAYAGDVLTLLGLAFSVWARIHLGKYWSGIVTLKEGHQLIRSGPFKIVRHPIYTGFLVAVIGSAISSSTGDGFAAVPLVFISFLVKIRREETMLTTEFGEEYRQFKRDVPALVPFIV